MTNDSVTVALMRRMGLTDVATADTDLQRLTHAEYINLEIFPKGKTQSHGGLAPQSRTPQGYHCHNFLRTTDDNPSPMTIISDLSELRPVF